ncbi:S1 family peptidase [Amycolatopsis sp. GA6-003]|uniref:S1 family peptidase n=1 Tax=Amycolatopsis sp. GA6-003 TaxID=2652444 RepID=UPI0039170368
MRIRSSALLLGTVLAATVVQASPASAIVGGTESSQPYSFLVSLQYDAPRPDGHRCTGVLIGAQWALTAGHCANTPTGATTAVPRGWNVRVGSLDTKSGGELVAVDKFYRRHASYNPPGEDLTVLHLARPVRAKPVRLTTSTPAVGSSVRILGWGATSLSCGDFADPVCFPRKLHEADTVVQPLAQCWDDNGISPPLCIGSLRDGVGPGVTDSGGPALVRDGAGWALAGTVVGSGIRGADLPDLYVDVTRNAGWINGIVSGTAVPPDTVIPNVEGTAKIGECMGSVIRPRTARDSDPALALTNGHCVPGNRPGPGKALVDQPAGLDKAIAIADRQGYPKTTARATRLAYATMTGTDIALYRLDRTYAQLAAAGAKVFRLSSSPMRAGDRLQMAYQSHRPQCEVAAVVPHLREGGWQQDQSVRYADSDECVSLPGYSGTALLSPDGNTVAGINNTHNRDGESCTEGNPCEVAADGTVTAVKGRSYGQQVSAIGGCLAPGNRIDLDRPGCRLTGSRAGAA